MDSCLFICEKSSRLYQALIVTDDILKDTNKTLSDLNTHIIKLQSKDNPHHNTRNELEILVSYTKIV